MEARSRGGKEMEADGSFGDRFFKLWYNKDVRQSARILSRALHYAAPSPHTQNGPKGAIPEAQRETSNFALLDATHPRTRHTELGV
ncbi:hypothetical protein LTR33_006657 [Friedmanniomyces endolithicus]|nr:hypothetical protein LTR33_006657 [Friedmanniomyces endolithicus]